MRPHCFKAIAAILFMVKLYTVLLFWSRFDKDINMILQIKCTKKFPVMIFQHRFNIYFIIFRLFICYTWLGISKQNIAYTSVNLETQPSTIHVWKYIHVPLDMTLFLAYILNILSLKCIQIGGGGIYNANSILWIEKDAKSAEVLLTFFYTFDVKYIPYMLMINTGN